MQPFEHNKMQVAGFKLINLLLALFCYFLLLLILHCSEFYVILSL